MPFHIPLGIGTIEIHQDLRIRDRLLLRDDAGTLDDILALSRKLRSRSEGSIKASATIFENPNARENKYSLGANALEHTDKFAGRRRTATQRVGGKFGGHHSESDSW